MFNSVIMKNIFTIIFLLVFISACNKENNSPEAQETVMCEFENPLEDILWLKTIVESFESENGIDWRNVIIQYSYKGQDVFLIAPCFQCPDAPTTVFDCEQNLLCELGGIRGTNTCPDFDKNATNEKILYNK